MLPVQDKPDYDISLIICAYNGGKFIEEALDSALSQKNVKLQIICIDDGSSDNTHEILNHYAKSHDNILFMARTNRGLAASRNLGLELASGKYVQFLDCDDSLETDACSRLYAFASSNNLDICSFSGFNIINSVKKPNNYWEFNNIPQDLRNTPLTMEDLADYLLYLPVSSCLSIYRRDFLDTIDNRFPEGLIFEDNVFFYKALVRCRFYGILYEKLYLRKVHDGQITKRTDSSLFDVFTIKKTCYELLYKHIGRSTALKYGKMQLAHMRSLMNNIDPAYRRQFKMEIINYLSYCLLYNLPADGRNQKDEKGIGRITARY